MDVFMADTGSVQAAAVVEELRADGHIVHSCRNTVGSVHDVPCAALRGTECPLDARPIDVAVGVGPRSDVDRLGDGEVCAIRHRIPLVLLDRPDDPLGRWAAAVAPASRAVQTISQVHAAVLPEHTAQARRTVGEWARRHDLDEAALDVEVRRRHGTLHVELWADGRLTEQDAEALGVYLTQCVRRFDPWVKGIDVSVHPVVRPTGT